MGCLGQWELQNMYKHQVQWRTQEKRWGDMGYREGREEVGKRKEKWVGGDW